MLPLVCELGYLKLYIDLAKPKSGALVVLFSSPSLK